MIVLDITEQDNTFFPVQALPTGYIYISNTSTSPASIFGESWEALPSNVFLRSSDSVNLTPEGSETVTLSVTHLPNHRHTASAYSSSGGANHFIRYAGPATAGHGTTSTGGGAAHNNVPAYRGAYAWRKVFNNATILKLDGDRYTKPYMPVGSYYYSVSDTSPASYFGGTWTQLKDRFVYITNSTPEEGGENTHTLTIPEMPSHSHTYTWQQGSGSGGTYYPESYNERRAADAAVTWGATGEGGAHENKPPYLAVNIWYRVS